MGRQSKSRRNLRSTLGGAGAVSAVLLISTLALATWVKSPGSEQWIGPSGSAGPEQTELLTNGPYYGLRSFKFWDYDRRLCVIEASQSSFNAESVTPAGSIKICEQSLGAQWKAVDLGSGRFVSAVQVCTDKVPAEQQRVRGARFWGASIEPDGSVKTKGEAASFELTDCKKWHPKKSCPKGKVATGIRAHYRDGAQGIIGIELLCQAVAQQKS
jgi:hypothetical protein